MLSLLWAAGRDGVVRLVDPEWQTFTGAPQHEDLRAWARRLVPAEDYERCVAEWRAALERGTIFQAQAHVRRRDGVFRQVLVRAAPVRGPDGAITGWQGCAVELDAVSEAMERGAALERQATTAREANEQLLLAGLRERVRAEEAEEAGERTTLLAEASRRLAVTGDAEAALRAVTELAVPALGDLCFVDVALEPQGGAPHGDELRRVAWAYAGDPVSVGLDTLTRHMPPGTVERVIRKALEARETRLVGEVSDDWLRSNAVSTGHLEIVRRLQLRSVLVVPLLIGDRAVGAMTFCFTTLSGRRYAAQDVATAREVADRAALAVENARLYRALERAVRVRDEFLTSTAHDVRTPISAIKVHTHLVRRYVEAWAEGGPVKEELAQIEMAADRIARLVGSLEDAARDHAGYEIHLRRRPTDLVELARRLTMEYGWRTARHDIRLQATMGKLIGAWDKDRLERTLDNIIGNAVKYSPDGGEVIVAVARERRDAIVRVLDHGIGIPAEDLPRIFERYHRGANAVGRIEGAGIGLADAFQVVTRHGGTISLANADEAGGGTVVTLRLPLAPVG